MGDRRFGKRGCETAQRTFREMSSRCTRWRVARWILASVASGALVSATSTGAARASDDAEVRVDRNMCGYNSMMLVLAYLNVPWGP